MSGSVESGRPTPTRIRVKSPLPRSLLQALQAVVAGEPAPLPVRISPNGRSISSWITTTRSSGTLSAPRAGPTTARRRSCRSAAAKRRPGVRPLPPAPQRSAREGLAGTAGPTSPRARSRPRSRRCASCRRIWSRDCRDRRSGSRLEQPGGRRPRNRRTGLATLFAAALALGGTLAALALGRRLFALGRFGLLADQLRLFLDLLFLHDLGGSGDVATTISSRSPRISMPSCR